MPTIEIPSGTMFFREQGSGEPLVLLMGVGADHTSWARQIPELARSFRVIAIDNRGSGRSGRAPGTNATAATFATDCVAVLDRLAVRRFHVAGYSFGAAVAMEVALSASARVIRASFHAGWAGPNAITTAVLDRSIAVARQGVDAFLEAACRRNFSPAFQESPAFPDFLQNVLKSAARPTAEGILAQALAARRHDARDRLPRLAVPCLVTTGEHDPVSPPGVAGELAGLIPGSRFHFFRGPHAWHAIPLEMADDLNRLLIGFHGASLPAPT